MRSGGQQGTTPLLRKNDLLLAGALVLLSLGMLFLSAVRAGNRQEETWIRILRDGEEIGVWPLSADAVFTVPASADREVVEGRIAGGLSDVNTVVIENGTCRVSEADCPDRICVERGRISVSGETIVCLPHRLVIEVIGAERAGVDDVSN
ncbi:MAG: NusG domain II-containing protein [Lachnospiraceae bacterium]|nr:NusG domain II-containing protein [Lachnospiraceae bacterium]